MGRILRARVTVLLVVLATFQSVGGPASRASGSNWGSDRDHACDASIFSQCVANDGIHYVFLDFLPAGWQSENELVFSGEYTPLADIVMWRTSACCSGTTDVRAYDGASDPSTEFIAWGICPTGSSKGNAGPNKTWCRAQVIYYNNGAYPSYYNSVSERKAVFCHELGHTMGLRHNTSDASSCMKKAPGTNTHLASHDGQMLTSLYPL